MITAGIRARLSSSEPQHPPRNMIILVRNIDRAIGRAELHAMFARFGRVESFDLVMDKDTGRSKGFGFADMPSDKQAVMAIKELDGLMLGNSRLRVKKAAKSSLRRKPEA